MARPVTLGIDVAFLARHTQDMGLLEGLYQEREREEQRQLEEVNRLGLQLPCYPTEVPLPFAEFIVESLDSNPSSAAEFWRRVAQVRARMQEREREREREGARRKGTFVTKIGNFCNENRELL
ncbi:hypothetical protein OS493_006148 [Desmophyllum pertusum]|uniref:Uncharacterized protein n=1 Tax=Desmophyllum pertusum TaxID=174260 RepID=A0A9X0A4C4_9CNID|nr:hypothetical protein OS493_006148 [Desmophyllum pertusum]